MSTQRRLEPDCYLIKRMKCLDNAIADAFGCEGGRPQNNEPQVDGMWSISCDNTDRNEDGNQYKSAQSRPLLFTDPVSFYPEACSHKGFVYIRFPQKHMVKTVNNLKTIGS